MCVVGVLLDDEFLNGVDNGDVGDVVAASLGVVWRAIHHELVVRFASTVDGPLGDGAVVKRALPNGRAAEDDAGHHGAEHERITRVQGEFGNGKGVDDTGAGSGLRFKDRGFAGDVYGVSDCADFESDIDTGDLADLNRHTFAVVNFEALGGGGQLILAGAEKRNGVGAGGVAFRVGGFIGGGINGADCDIRHRGAGGVEDPPCNGGAEFLREQTAREQTQS